MPAPHLLPKRVFVGAIISSRSATDLSIIERGILGVGSGGVIRFLKTWTTLSDRFQPSALPQARLGQHPQNRQARLSPAAQLASQRIAPRLPCPSRPRAIVPAKPSRCAELTSIENATTRRSLAASHHLCSEPTRRKHLNESNSSSSTSSTSTAGDAVIQAHTSSARKLPLLRLHRHAHPCLSSAQHRSRPAVRAARLAPARHLSTREEIEDARYARKTYESVVHALIDSGTTTACYYATLQSRGVQDLGRDLQ